MLLWLSIHAAYRVQTQESGDGEPTEPAPSESEEPAPSESEEPPTSESEEPPPSESEEPSPPQPTEPPPPPCDEEFYVPSGTITSPNYPDNYPNKRRCAYRILTDNVVNVRVNDLIASFTTDVC